MDSDKVAASSEASALLKQFQKQLFSYVKDLQTSSGHGTTPLKPDTVSRVSVVSANNSVGGSEDNSHLSVTQATSQSKSPNCSTSPSQLVQPGVQVVIKVINPTCKREYKCFNLILHDLSSITLRSLKEEVLEQLGKNVICFDLKFDIGYMKGAQKISFSQADAMGEVMQKVVSKGYKLWCEGIDSRKRSVEVLSVISDEEDDAKQKGKKLKTNSFEERNLKIAEMADKLKEKHGHDYNMVQYKFWAETLLNKRHQSWETPPAGFIWGKPKEPKRSKMEGSTENVIKSVGDMAIQIATVMKSTSSSPSTPEKAVSSTVGISPGRKIDMQGKLIQQLELIHNMFERGAVTIEQFEQRRMSIMKQLEKLDD